MTNSPANLKLINDILDMARFGDRIIVTRRNEARPVPSLSTVIGAVISAPDVSPAVGVDLYDGDPNIIRRETGEVFGTIHHLDLVRDRNLIAVFHLDEDDEEALRS